MKTWQERKLEFCDSQYSYVLKTTEDHQRATDRASGISIGFDAGRTDALREVADRLVPIKDRLELIEKTLPIARTEKLMQHDAFMALLDLDALLKDLAEQEKEGSKE